MLTHFLRLNYSGIHQRRFSSEAMMHLRPDETADEQRFVCHVLGVCAFALLQVDCLVPAVGSGTHDPDVTRGCTVYLLLHALLRRRLLRDQRRN